MRAVVFVRESSSIATARAMRYLCRMHFHAGRPAVQVAFTLKTT